MCIRDSSSPVGEGRESQRRMPSLAITKASEDASPPSSLYGGERYLALSLHHPGESGVVPPSFVRRDIPPNTDPLKPPQPQPATTTTQETNTPTTSTETVVHVKLLGGVACTTVSVYHTNQPKPHQTTTTTQRVQRKQQRCGGRRTRQAPRWGGVYESLQASGDPKVLSHTSGS